MRYAIIGDIHGNADALAVVVRAIKESNIDKVVCLGDIVGYGAEPTRCIEMVQEMQCACIVGNHDWAAIDRIAIDFFNAYAKTAAQWTRAQLSPEHKRFLGELPLHLSLEHFAISHGTFHQPESFNYIQTVFDAQLSFDVLKSMNHRVGFLGHSHVPVAFFNTEPIAYSLDPIVPVQPERMTIINSGSVGQPRDENPRASFAIYDTEALRTEIIRLDYDIDAAAEKIRRAGLPEILAARLYHGK